MEETRTYSSDEDSFTRRPSSPSPTDPTPRHTQLSPSTLHSYSNSTTAGVGTGTPHSTFAESPVVGYAIPRKTVGVDTTLPIMSNSPKPTVPLSEFTSQTEDTHKEVCMSPTPTEYLSTTSPEYIHPPSGPEVVPYSSDPEVHHKPDIALTHEDTLSKSGSTNVVAASPSGSPDSAEKEVVGNSESKGVMVKKWKLWAMGALLVILIIVAVVIGVVLGTRKNGGGGGNGDGSSNGSSSSNDNGDEDGAPTLTNDNIPPPPTHTDSVAIPDEEDLAMGVSYNSTFTYYGTGDEGGGWNCKTHIIGCGFTAEPGFTAGVSQNLYGNRPGKGEGPVCGTCWQLESWYDSSGFDYKRNVTVIVNDICPAQGNDVCAQQNLTDLSTYDVQVNFNLCIDTGTSDAMFGEDREVGLATGKATRVSCDSWRGEKVTDS